MPVLAGRLVGNPIKNIVGSKSPVNLNCLSVLVTTTRLKHAEKACENTIDSAIHFHGRLTLKTIRNIRVWNLQVLIKTTKIASIMGLDWTKRMV